MASDIQIVNQALLRVGSKTISGWTDTKREREVAEVFYESCRDQVLRDFPWNFARRRIELAKLSSSAPTNWEYVYAMPADCLRALRIVYPGDRRPRVSMQIPFEVASTSTQRVLYCDLDPVELEYSARVEDLNLWDVAATQALGWLLVAEMALPLAGKADIASTARQAYGQVMSSAIAQNMAEGFAGAEVTGEFLAVRGMTL